MCRQMALNGWKSNLRPHLSRRHLGGLCIAYLCLCSSSFKPWGFSPLSRAEQTTIFVVNHGWHAGLVIPANVLGHKLEVISPYFDSPAFYELGWGDSGFYQAEEITAGLVAKALLWPSESVMHVVALPMEPVSYFSGSEVVALTLSSEGVKRLTARIAASFKYDSNGRLEKMRPGLYGQSLFFVGAGTYHGFNTCNSWTANVLASGGVPIDDWLSLTSGSVMVQTRQALLAIKSARVAK